MGSEILSQDSKQNVWISTTGYRTLYILRLLMDSPKTLNEIIEILKQNELISKSISKDTIRIAINTLRKAGCVLSRPSKRNAYKYELLSHPFLLDLSKDEIKALLKLRKLVCSEIEWQDIFITNDIYEKIAELTMDDKTIHEFNAAKPLNKLNTSILWEIEGKNYFNKKINIEYYSPEQGFEEMEIIPKEITYREGKLYLVCYMSKYKTVTAVNIERIRKVLSVNIVEETEEKEDYYVVYKLINNAVEEYIPEEGEIIVDKTPEHIVVKAHVTNEFKFIQRILMFGADFVIISPEFFKERLRDKIKKAKRGYE